MTEIVLDLSLWTEEFKGTTVYRSLTSHLLIYKTLRLKKTAYKEIDFWFSLNQPKFDCNYTFPSNSECKTLIFLRDERQKRHENISIYKMSNVHLLWYPWLVRACLAIIDFLSSSPSKHALGRSGNEASIQLSKQPTSVSKCLCYPPQFLYLLWNYMILGALRRSSTIVYPLYQTSKPPTYVVWHRKIRYCTLGKCKR